MLLIMLFLVSRIVLSGFGVLGLFSFDMKIDRGLFSDNSGFDKVNFKELCSSIEDAEVEVEVVVFVVVVVVISIDEGFLVDVIIVSVLDKSFMSKDFSGLMLGGMIFVLLIILIKMLLYDYVVMFIVLWMKLK